MRKIIINGAGGKMGRVIAQTIEEMDNCEVICGFDIKPPSISAFPVYSDYKEFSGKGDVIIDFSHPASLTSILNYAVSSKTPIVVATTGLSVDQRREMKEASKEVPVFFSANMSLGVNLLIDLVCKAAAVLEDNYDIEIIERHHNQKIDAPSGTALAIADALNEQSEKGYEYIYDRHSQRRKRSQEELGIHAIRGGTIVGDHTVLFAGKDEVIEIKHSAASKEVFATGSIRAALFLCNQKPGMYNMKDLVNG